MVYQFGTFGHFHCTTKAAEITRNAGQVFVRFSLIRELRCCFHFWKENPFLGKLKTFSTLTFKHHSSGKQDKQKYKPFSSLLESPHTSHHHFSRYSKNLLWWLLPWHSHYFVFSRRLSWILCHNVTFYSSSSRHV